MRFIIFSTLLFTLLSCNNTKNVPTKPNPLNGTWLPTKQEMSGNPMPKAFYEKQKLILLDSTYTLVAESVDKGTVQISGDKMDIFAKEGVNAGKHFKAIFKLENGVLTICYNLLGDIYPESFETKGRKLYF